MDEETVGRIKDRIERCRQLAAHTDDAFTKKVLIDFAEEGEAHLRRLGVINDGNVPDMPNPQG